MRLCIKNEKGQWGVLTFHRLFSTVVPSVVPKMCSVPGTPAVPGENLWEHILGNTGTPVFSRVFGICSYVPEKSYILLKHKNQLVVSSLNAYLRVYRFFWLLGTGPFFRSQKEDLSC